MRWNCPHCGVALMIPEEKLSASWSFSKCFKCNGFTLVRKNDANLIKLDQPPANALESGSARPPLLSREATERLAKYQQRAAEKARAAAAVAAAATAQQLEVRPVTVATPPPPPMSQPKNIVRRKLLPAAIAMTGLISIGSGIYLYNQGQQLWRKARAAAVEVRPEKHSPVAPVSAVAPAAAEQQAIRPAVVTRELVDQLHSNAMAPARPEKQPEVRALWVRPRVEHVKLRSGPGLNFNIVGTTGPHNQYVVNQWQGEWFQVSIPDPLSKAKRLAWIRNDLVQLSGNGGD